MRRIWIGLIVIAALVAVAAGGVYTAGAAQLRGVPQARIHVTLSEFRIDVSPANVHRGDLVELTIRNAGEQIHELEVQPYDREAEDIKPGEVRMLRFRVTRSGRVELACHKPGHYEGGMYTFLEAGE
ncbi:MAG TPA: hypothetical protein VGK74_07235 [Symbiobacteriaceae bacterium]